MDAEQKKQVEQLLALKEGVINEWELEFLTSIKEKRADHDLSEKQLAVLEKTWKAKFPEGDVKPKAPKDEEIPF